MPKRTLNGFDIALLALLALATGCGRDDLPPLAEATGVLTLDGKPLPEAIVSFTPIQGGRPSQAVTNERGEFELGTFEVGDGALIGSHRVAVNPLQPPPMSYAVNPRAADYEPPFPDRYWTPKSSGLTAEVVAGQSNEYAFELESTR